MQATRGSQASALWRTEDWLSVWTGLLILGVLVAGVTLTLPSWRWMTAGEFARKAAAWTAKTDALAADAAAGGERGLAESALLLSSTLRGRARGPIGDAAGAVLNAAKDSVDASLKATAEKMANEVRAAAGRTLGRVLSWDNLKWSLLILAGFWVIATLSIVLLREKPGPFLAGFPVLFVLTALSFLIAGNDTVAYYGIEQVFWALFIGLFISNVLGVPGWLKAAAKSELYIKTGLVLLGAEVLIGSILRAGAFGLGQAVLVIVPVWYVCFWLAKRFGLDSEFGAILATGVSVCGVSAAIAAGGALKGDPKKVSHTVSLILLLAIPMLILEPLVAKALHLSPRLAGAWIGGTIDTTAAVVAAGSIAGDKARDMAVVVKFAQNAFIGVIAFLLALWSATARKSPAAIRPSLSEIWLRFPKFVLGFVIVSLVFSLVITEQTAAAVTRISKELRAVWFSLAFLAVGLETRFKDLFAMGGGKPALTFVSAQVFNIFWTLLVAFLLYGGILFPAPTF